MNDPLDELTRELARLEPRRPGPKLESRIGQVLEDEETQPMPRLTVCRRVWLLGLPLAAAAVLGLAVAWLGTRKPENPARASEATAQVAATGADRGVLVNTEAALDLVRNANYLIDAEDEGVVNVPTPVPLRKVTWQFVSTSEFRDRRDNAVIRVFVPREETVLIPVTFH